ncbi:MAG: MarR family transcriptional regulator [Gemmatimonadaceae bacterium]
MPNARRRDEPPSAARIADRLHSVAIHLLRRLRAEDQESGLSGPRLSTLSVVVFGGPITLGELAAAEQVKPPTMTRLVAALEARGLVVREGDATDARVVRVRATARGMRLLQEGRGRRIARLHHRLQGLPAIDLGKLAVATAILEDVVREL